MGESTIVRGTREAVEAEALSWLKTKWHHRGRVKGVGVDCAMFVREVYSRAGVGEIPEPGAYPPDWHKHRPEERFLSYLPPGAVELPEGEIPGLGDLLMFKIGKVFSHSAICLHWPQGIHAAIQERMVTLVDIDRDVGLVDAPRRCFTFEGWHGG